MLNALEQLITPMNRDNQIYADQQLRLKFFKQGRIPFINNVHRWHFGYFRCMTLTYIDLLAELKCEIMNTSADLWVRERRLRPVYELLDSGNNKKVITEVDKLLKKQPSFTCAKVLKALALVRLNKNEEAETILEPIQHEVPTDDGTIQALSICYRELEQPETLCAYLEAACKKEQSEELLTHCFMAQVRVCEFQKQHHTAMTLFKLYNKPNYFYWAVASLIIKYDQADDGKKESLSLVLAERMMEKYISEQRTGAEEVCIILFLNALEKQEKYEKMLDCLVKHGHSSPQSPWSNNEFHRYYCKALKQLDKMDELFEYLKATFFKNPEEYDVLKQMIIVFGKSHAQWVQDFFDHLTKNHPSRAVALADLLYCRDYLSDLQILQSRLQLDLELIIRYGADKPSFSSDIADYYPLLSRLNINIYLGLLEVDKYDSVANIIRDVNYEIFLRAMVPDESALTRLRRANRCFGKYIACEEAMKQLRSENNMRTKESEFYDQFIVIAASCLMGENVDLSNSNNVTDYPTTILGLKEDWASVHNLSPEIQEMHKTLYKDEPEDENVPVKEFSGKYMQESRVEYLLFIAASILEYGLARSPHNYSLRVLLSRVYHRLGANKEAVKLIQALDLKHIQWDTLGYLIFQEAIIGGLYTDVHKVLVTAENMYYSFRKESMEHIITCYKFNSYSKIAEFMGFRDQIFASTQYKLVTAERRLMELLVSGMTPQDLKKVCESVVKDVDLDLLMRYPHGDNRDFTILEGFVSERCLENLKTITADIEVQYMKIRLTSLLLVSKLVVFAPHYDEPADKFSILNLIRALESHIQGWKLAVQIHDEAFKDSSVPNELMFHGFWPPTYSRYCELGTWQSLYDMVHFLIELASGNESKGDKQDSPDIDRLTKIIVDSCDVILNNIRSKYPEDKIDQVPYFSVEEVIEKTHYAVESFSFYRIIISVAISILKDRFEMKNSAAKKKARAKAVDDRKARANCIQRALEKYQELHGYASALHTALSKRTYESYESSEAAWKTLLKPSFLYSAFPTCYDKFTKNLKECHECQTKEIMKGCASLIDFLRLLQP